MRHEEKCSKEREDRGFKCSCCNCVFAIKDDCITHQQCEHADVLSKFLFASYLRGNS